MTEIFKFENQEVRFVGTADNPWWVAADICAVLDISDTSQAVEALDEDEKLMRTIYASDQGRNMWCINESGLYSLALRSRKPQAKRFKKWITSEVLPAIRKTGSYSIKEQPKSSLEEAILLADFAARSAQNAGVNKDVTEQLKLDGLMKMYPDYQPLLKPQKEAIASSNPLPEAPMTPTEVGQAVAERLGLASVSARKINRKLLHLGYQSSVTRIKKSNGKEVHDYYQATEKGKKHSTLLMSAYVDGEGKTTKAQLKWFSSIVAILVNNWEEGNEE